MLNIAGGACASINPAIDADRFPPPSLPLSFGRVIDFSCKFIVVISMFRHILELWILEELPLIKHTLEIMRILMTQRPG